MAIIAASSLDLMSARKQYAKTRRRKLKDETKYAYFSRKYDSNNPHDMKIFFNNTNGCQSRQQLPPEEIQKNHPDLALGSPSCTSCANNKGATTMLVNESI